MKQNYRPSRDVLQSILSFVKLGLSSLRAEAPQRLGDWAQDHFKLAGESSHVKGAWVAWAFQVGILDFMSDDRIQELDVLKAKRIGYTKMLTAYISYNVAHRRRKQALWQPTDDDRDSYVKTEIDPLLDPLTGVRAINRARKRGGAGKRRNDETIKYKAFRDSALHLLGGKAARAYRRITVAVSILDELSKFDRSVEGAGPPRGLAYGRLEGAPYPKMVCGSTPLIKGMCNIEDAAAEAEDLARFHIVCKHCGADHPLIWGGKDKSYGFKWDDKDPSTVRHVCPHCLQSITQADYIPSGVPVSGDWVCEKSGKRYGADRIWKDDQGVPCNPPRHLAVHVWTAYSPQREWTDIVREFLSAAEVMKRGETGPMALFVNETRGETFEIAGDRTDGHALQERAEEYSLGTVPRGGLILTAGIDVQGNRLEVTIYAWGIGMESWVVDHIILEGNPAIEEDWRPLTAILEQQWTTESGIALALSAISIDSSDQTQAVYNWCVGAGRHLPQLRPIKGSSQEGDPILGRASLKDVDWRGHLKKNGVKLWVVGVDTAKDLLHGQLAIKKPAPGVPAPGYIHTSKELPREWYEQLTAEQRILVKINGRHVYRWVPRRKRNEVLDCRNYALHAAMGLGIHKWGEARWKKLHDRLHPKTPETGSAYVTIEQETPKQQAPKAQPVEKEPQQQRKSSLFDVYG